MEVVNESIHNFTNMFTSNIFNFLKKVLTLVIIVAVFVSCSSGKGLFQKRKYSKGYHISLKKKVADNKNIIAPGNDQLTQNETLGTKATTDNKNYSIIQAADTLVIADKIRGDYTEKIVSDTRELDRKTYLKTATRTNSILAKITAYIQDWDIGKKLLKAIETKNLTSLEDGSRKSSHFMTFLLYLNMIFFALVLLGIGVGLISQTGIGSNRYRFLGILFLALGISLILLLIKINNSSRPIKYPVFAKILLFVGGLFSLLAFLLFIVLMIAIVGGGGSLF